MTGLREKFGQNPKLLKYLGDMQHLTLGEASRDLKWGIGFSLEDPKALDPSKWLPSGNLLSRSLTRIQDELVQNSHNLSLLPRDRHTQKVPRTRLQENNQEIKLQMKTNPQH